MSLTETWHGGCYGLVLQKALQLLVEPSGWLVQSLQWLFVLSCIDCLVYNLIKLKAAFLPHSYTLHLSLLECSHGNRGLDFLLV